MGRLFKKTLKYYVAGCGMGLLLDVWENVSAFVAVIVPVIDHRSPVRGNIIFELSQLPWQRLVHGLCYLLDQAVDCPLLGNNEKIATSWEWCNPRIIHVVSLTLSCFVGI